MSGTFWAVFLVFCKHSVKFDSNIFVMLWKEVRVTVKPVSLVKMVWGSQNRRLKTNCKVLGRQFRAGDELMEMAGDVAVKLLSIPRRAQDGSEGRLYFLPSGKAGNRSHCIMNV